MRQLTRNEEYVLLSILNLEDNAYLVTIQEYLKENADNNLSFGTLFVLLKRLEKSNYIKSKIGEATAKRGGKAIKFFKLTKEGYKVLEEIHEIQASIWSNFESNNYTF